MKIPCAIIGSGNIGTDLMMKILRRSDTLALAAMIGIDEQSDGLARAREHGVFTTHEGLETYLSLPQSATTAMYFDATSARVHHHHDALLAAAGKPVIDLTPAAVGPYAVPVVDIKNIARQRNVNMVTCGGQATVPIVRAVASVAEVYYAEIVASIASRSAGPGTRANIDEFTATTAKALETIGGAARGKAIVILNPAEPPMMMRDTVMVLSDHADGALISEAVESMVAQVQQYVPGYRLKQAIQFERYDNANKLHIPGFGDFNGLKTSVFLEVAGAADYLPAYAGNLDIMTSAALRVGELLVQQQMEVVAS